MAIDFDRLVIGPLNDIFGTPGIWYRPRGQQAFLITGVFDAGAKNVKEIGEDGIPITDVQPILGIRLSDFTTAGITPDQGDKVTIAGVDYQVSNVDPDGQGEAKLSLNQLAVPA